MTAQMIHLKTKQQFVPSEPDRADPEDYTPRTPREQRIATLAHLAGFREGLEASEGERQAVTSADVEYEVNRHRTGRHLHSAS